MQTPPCTGSDADAQVFEHAHDAESSRVNMSFDRVQWTPSGGRWLREGWLTWESAGQPTG